MLSSRQVSASFFGHVPPQDAQQATLPEFATLRRVAADCDLLQIRFRYVSACGRLICMYAIRVRHLPFA